MAAETRRRVLEIGSAIAVMVAAVLIVVPALRPGPSHPEHPAATPMASPGPPIDAEAQVFRTEPGELAVSPDADASRPAKRRTLVSYRRLRAYPGAPPRIPHALTELEFRATTCTTCHERGGYSARFTAYTPVTPHPEYTNCLQCHVPQQTTSMFVPSDWRTVAWPEVGRSAMQGSPPWIPHDLQLRGNCLTCHGGPAAVEEIRTTHPERANCRQCHVAAGSAEPDDVFARPLDRSVWHDARGNEEGR